MSPKLANIEACVFDAYGTLFDVNSAARSAQDALGEKWQPLGELWRAKQLQYTWLRSLQGKYADFWQITGDALDFAMSSLHLEEPALRARLMNLYLTLSAYPQVQETLRRLKAAGQRLAILSNGTPKMLAAAAASAGIAEVLDHIFSVDELKLYKPHPSVYALACQRLNLAPGNICFLSANGWDAYSAKAFGFRVLWLNRTGQCAERIPEAPDAQITALGELPGIVLA
ncbi:MAG: haloacid dehalogenase type II [Candidatus Acidiferrum sp.]|jgi:2-haloacid dehalogenase